LVALGVDDPESRCEVNCGAPVHPFDVFDIAVWVQHGVLCYPPVNRRLQQLLDRKLQVEDD
jgi:hypothetical protein